MIKVMRIIEWIQEEHQDLVTDQNVEILISEGLRLSTWKKLNVATQRF